MDGEPDKNLNRVLYFVCSCRHRLFIHVLNGLRVVFFME